MNSNKVNFLLLILLILFILINYSAVIAQVDISTQNKKIIDRSIMKGNSTAAAYVLDPNEDLKVIVQFNAKPLCLINGRQSKINYNELASLQTSIDYEHSIFKSDLQKIESDGVMKWNSIYKASYSQILFEYKNVFNGAAISAKRWVIDEIKKLAYVKDVYEDKEVKAVDDQSNNVIGADSVWSKYGLTGSGIKIGILDTGIDYKHPDLGGGIGPSFKILGGYDFINNDSDPMDDNGHGTHIAGIAAANGDSLKGVAPDAKLYDYKVLDKYETGSYSIIIAGINRALDPDNNPNTNDAVNIINLSLIGSGDPDDALSQAVDNASYAGILCVTAAGNSGPGYQTIGSPGCARTAITVGAADNNDLIASFSSRGPTNVSYIMKPDLLAPGVSIKSTKVGGGYINLSGSSTAAAQVTGCAALILQLHSDWTPLLVKSVLVETAKDIGQDVWTQGGGRVNVLDAVLQKTVITPSSLSFGVDDLSQTVWSNVDTLSIYNYSSTSESYSISTEGSLPLGMSITFSTLNIVIEPNNFGHIIVTTDIDNNYVPFYTSNPAAYVGKLVVQSSDQKTYIPFSFIKSRSLRFKFDNNVNKIVIWGQHNKDASTYFYNPDKYLVVDLPKDIYDVYINYDNGSTIIFKENIDIEKSGTISVNKSDTKNKITFPMQNELGQSVKMDNNAIMFTHKPTGLRETLWLNQQTIKDTMNFSDFSGNFLMEWSGIHFEGANKIYKANGYANTITHDTTFSTYSNSYRHLKFIYNVPPGIQSIDQNEQTVTSYILLGWGSQTDLPNLTFPFVQDAYFVPPPTDTFGLSYIKKYSQAISNTTPYYLLKGMDTLKSVFIFEETKPNLKTTFSEIPINLGPPHWGGEFSNSSSSIYITAHDFSYFFNQLDDYNSKQLDSLQYELYCNSQLVDHGNLQNGGYANKVLAVSPNAYKLKIFGLPGSFINDRYVNATVEAIFDTRLADASPPSIKSLNIISNGKYVNIIDPLQSSQIQFSLSDSYGIRNVLLEYKSELSSEWHNLTLTNSNTLYSTDIPDTLKKGYTSLRITASDNSDNKLIYTVEPAFKYASNHPPVIAAITDTTAREDSLYTSQINASDVDGDSLRFYLTAKPQWLNIDSIKGILSGIPKAKNVGYSNAAIKVTDNDGGETSKQFMLHIIHTNHVPTISAINDTTAKEDSLYTLQVKAADIDGDSLFYSLTTKPRWINIDQLNGIITGIPKAENVGDTVVSVKVNDSYGGEALQSYKLFVLHTNHNPFVQIIPDSVAKQDSLYSTYIKGNDPDSLLFGDIVSYHLINSPSWLGIDTANGHMHGTPNINDVGLNSINIILSDGKGGAANYSYKLNVLKRKYIFQIITTPNTIAFEDSLYHYQILAEDSAYNANIKIRTKKDNQVKLQSIEMKYSLLNAPAWINLDSTLGILEGIPGAKDVGKDTINIKISNSENFDTTFSYLLTVIHTNHTPSSFALLSPANLDTLQLINPPKSISFIWNASKDIDQGDSIRYTFKFSGPNMDTVIYSIKDTLLKIDIMPHLVIKSLYSWRSCIRWNNKYRLYKSI